MMASTKGTKKELPAGWKWVRLGEVVKEYQAGFACGERDTNGVVQVRMNNLDTRGNFIWDNVLRVPREGNNISSFLLLSGDVLFNNTNSTELVGKSALFTGYSEPVVYSNHFTRLRTNLDRLVPEYLSCWLNQQWQKGVFAAICNRWIGQSAVKSDKLLGLEIPLPPLSEQRRIAAILKEQMAAVVKARLAAQARLEAVKALPAAFLRQVFESDVSADWEIKQLGKIAFLQRGYDLPKSRRIPGKYPVVTSSGIIDIHNEYRASGPGVAIGRSGSVGRVHYIQEDFWPHNTALFINNFFDNNPLFVFYLLQWVNIKGVSSGSGVPTLDRKAVHKILVPDPPKEKQIAIAIYLQDKSESALHAEKLIDEELSAINALPAAFLRRAFSGEL